MKLTIFVFFFLILDEDSTQVPFPELSGESVEYLGQASDAILAISNYRLFIRFKDSFVNVRLFLLSEIFVYYFIKLCDGRWLFAN